MKRKIKKFSFSCPITMGRYCNEVYRLLQVNPDTVFTVGINLYNVKDNELIANPYYLLSIRELGLQILSHKLFRDYYFIPEKSLNGFKLIKLT